MLVLDQYLKNYLAYLNFDAIFWVSWTIYYKMYILIFQKDVENFEVEHKTVFLELFGVGGAV